MSSKYYLIFKNNFIIIGQCNGVCIKYLIFATYKIFTNSCPMTSVVSLVYSKLCFCFNI